MPLDDLLDIFQDLKSENAESINNSYLSNFSIKISKIQRQIQSLDLFLNSASAEFQESEKEIVSILKSAFIVLEIEPESVTKEILKAMYILGQIYLKSNYYNKYAKAATIFQYCAKFSEKYSVELLSPNLVYSKKDFIYAALETEKHFLKNINENLVQAFPSMDVIQEQICHYQQNLYMFREQIKQKLETIDTRYLIADISITDKVKNIYKDCRSFYINESNTGLIQQLIIQSIKLLGSPPEGCEYSIIALGSLAYGTFTPWSDLEFAILIKDQEDKGREDEYREYFRNLTKLLWIKVINLGETHVRNIGIEALNNYKTVQKEDNWFWDNVTKIGFTLDSTLDAACKIPLGRQEGYRKRFFNKEKNEYEISLLPSFELIKTPDEMMEFQANGINTKQQENIVKIENWFEVEPFLVQTLQTCTIIYGSQMLLREYENKLLKFREENIKLIKERALKILQKDLNKYTLKINYEKEDRFNVKIEFYRFADRVVNALNDYFGITQNNFKALTVWEVTEIIYNNKLLSNSILQNLIKLTNISNLMRLITYQENKGRYEGLLIEDNNRYRESLPCFIKLTYQTCKLLTDELNLEKGISLDTFINTNGDYLMAQIYAMFNNYKMAILCINNAIEGGYDNKQMMSYQHLFYRKKQLQEAKKAKVAFKNNKDIQNVVKINYILKDDIKIAFNLYEILDSYKGVALAYLKLQDIDNALKYYNQYLTLNFRAHTSTFYNIKLHLYSVDFDQIFSSYEDTLNVIESNLSSKYYKYLKIYDNNFNSISYSENIAQNYSSIAEYFYFNNITPYRAVDYYNKALEIRQKIYTSNHPKIADSYDILGEVYLAINKNNEAEECYLKVLKIRQVCCSSLIHQSIAKSYDNLVDLYRNMNEYSISVHYAKIALTIRKLLPENNLKDIAESLDNLGICYSEIHNYNAALQCYKEAIEIKERLNPSISNLFSLISSLSHLAILYNTVENREAEYFCLKRINFLKMEYTPSVDEMEICTNYNIDLLGTIKLNYDSNMEDYMEV